MSNPFRGIQYFLQGIKWLTKPGLRSFVIVPFCANVLLFSVLISSFIYYISGIMAWVEGYLPSWLDWITWLMWPIFVLALMLLVFQTFTLMSNLLLAPFNGLLSEKTEIIATGRPFDEIFSWQALLKQAPKSIWRELQKIFYFLPRATILLILFLIPGVNIIAGLLWFVFSAWMMAIEYADYPMDNHRIGFTPMKNALKRHKLSSWTFGMMVSLFTMIPVINFIVMPAAVIGGTLLWTNELSKEVIEIPADKAPS